MIFSTISAGFFTGAGLIMAVGAQNAFILRQGVQRQHVGLVITICALGDIFLIMSGVAGMGKLVQTWPALLEVLRFLGAGFLAIYGMMAAKRAIQGTEKLNPSEQNITSRRKVLLSCLAFTFLNPHVYLDTMVLIGSISTHYPGNGKWWFGLGTCISSIIWFTTLTYGARFLQPIFRNPKSWQIFDGFTALFMMTLSILLLWPIK